MHGPVWKVVVRPRKLPLSPFLLAWFSVLYLYARNAVHVPLPRVFWPLAIATAIAAGASIVGLGLFGDKHRSGAFAAVVVVLSLSYGHVSAVLSEQTVGSFVIGRDLVLVPLWVVLSLAGTFWVARLKSRHEVGKILLRVAAVMLLLVVAQSAVGWWNQRSARAAVRSVVDDPAVEAGSHGAVASEQSALLRSIYYLVFDRYGGEPTIERHIKIDNSDFYRELRERGFYIAEKSLSNYPKTVHSMASSLNLMYLDGIAREMGRDSPNWTPLYQMMRDTRAVREIRAMGLSHVYVGSPWEWLAYDSSADINVRYLGGSEFLRWFLSTTIADPVIRRVPGLSDRFDQRRYVHNSALFQFDQLKSLRDDPRPKFVFSHFQLPHDPYTFKRDGTWASEQDEREHGKWWESYGEQLFYTNKRILELVDHLLGVPEEERPIIVLTADEGVFPHNNLYGLGNVHWEEASDDEILLKFPILNAFYFPDGDYSRLYPEISPVNNLRVILSQFFGRRYPPLPDESYIFPRNERPYDLVPVTDVARSTD